VSTNETKQGRTFDKPPWAWGFASVLLIATCVAAISELPQDHRPSCPSCEDCSVVERLGHKWIGSVGTVPSLNDRESQDPAVAANQESAMSATISDAEHDVSNRAISAQLNKWAQGATLLAETQKVVIRFGRQGISPARPDADYADASGMTRNAMASLQDLCPHMPSAKS
jgi:hypothetical protein